MRERIESSARGRARTEPAAPRRGLPIHDLQRSAGNAAVTRMLHRAPQFGWDDAEALKQAEDEAKRGQLDTWKRELLTYTDERDDDRAWGTDEVDAHPNKLRIYFFQRGEQYIHAAAMRLEPKSTVEIVYDVTGVTELYRAAGAKEGHQGKEAVKATADRLDPGGSKKSTEERMIELTTNPLRRALAIRQFLLNSGIAASRIKLVGVKSTQGMLHQNPNRATNIVNTAMRADPRATRAVIKAGLPQGAEERVAKTIEDSGLKKGEKVALLWIRATGKNPGGAPEFDTRESFAEQIIELLGKQFKDRTIALIGDQLFDSDDVKVPGGTIRVNRKLVSFWARQGLNFNEQVLFLERLNAHADCIAIGIESGVLELPALFGMPTIYLEPAKVKDAKGNRWRDFWAVKDRNQHDQERSMYTIARLLFAIDHDALGDVVTANDRLQRWITGLGDPLKVEAAKKGDVKALWNALLTQPLTAGQLFAKWQQIDNQLLRTARKSVKKNPFTKAEIERIRGVGHQDELAFGLNRRELERLATQIKALTAELPTGRVGEQPIARAERSAGDLAAPHHVRVMDSQRADLSRLDQYVDTFGALLARPKVDQPKSAGEYAELERALVEAAAAKPLPEVTKD